MANRKFYLLEEFVLLFEEASAGLDRALMSLSRHEYQEYMERLASFPSHEVELMNPDENQDRPVTFEFVRLNTDGNPAFRLGVVNGSRIKLMCGPELERKGATTVRARAGGVSCAMCATKARECSVPVVVQFEELPVLGEHYSNPENARREVMRVMAVRNERLQRLNNLFLAAGGAI